MSLWSRQNAGFIVNEDDSGDKFIYNGDGAGVASTAEHFMRYQDGDAESAPKFLSNGSGDYSVGNCVATDSGWAMAAGTPSQGNDNADADPEILVCSRGLRESGVGDPTAVMCTIGNLTDKTKFYPDGETFTGVASSTLGDLVVYAYFNEPVGVIGDVNIVLKQATALGSDFATLTYRSSVSNLDAGIVAFELAASVDTQTSAVTNNTLGIGSSDAWSENSGRITKYSDIILSETADETLVLNDGASTEGPSGFGDIAMEDGDRAEFALNLPENASFTVS
jgi:hypothetical protein